MTESETDNPARQWVRKLATGEVLFREGDADRRVFLLLAGRVEIIKDGEVVTEVGVGESFIGEISALTGRLRVLAPRAVLVTQWSDTRSMAQSTSGNGGS